MEEYQREVTYAPKKTRINWDALGAGASFVCAIHCAALPLLLSVVPLMGISFFENPYIEYSLMFISFIIGLIALYRGYSHHKGTLPIVLFATGFPLLVFSHIKLQGIISFSIIGFAALLIIGAHILNYRSRQVRPVLR